MPLDAIGFASAHKNEKPSLRTLAERLEKTGKIERVIPPSFEKLHGEDIETIFQDLMSRHPEDETILNILHPIVTYLKSPIIIDAENAFENHEQRSVWRFEPAMQANNAELWKFYETNRLRWTYTSMSVLQPLITFVDPEINLFADTLESFTASPLGSGINWQGYLDTAERIVQEHVSEDEALILPVEDIYITKLTAPQKVVVAEKMGQLARAIFLDVVHAYRVRDVDALPKAA